VQKNIENRSEKTAFVTKNRCIGFNFEQATTSPSALNFPTSSSYCRNSRLTIQWTVYRSARTMLKKIQ